MIWGCARTVASWGPVERVETGWLDVRPGLVAARVSPGRRHHWVTVRHASLPGPVRERILGSVAADHGLREAVLLGRTPVALAGVFERHRAVLFPRHPSALDVSCSCPVPGCAHGRGAVTEMARVFDADPYLLLTWRGLERGELLRRAGRSRGALSVRSGPPPVATFWERTDPPPACPVWSGDPGDHRPAGPGTDRWAGAQRFLRGAPPNALRDGRKPLAVGDVPVEQREREIDRGDEPT
ncbi:hypothetical protein PWG71_18240 [Nocardiopsis sp. N85]|uniref:hypothetical protein n=1 Tax=Nocardiopsis sp. N85 TaxID=3029400 RepID=UPI00237F74FE|nr:hypothetical protein [Nocardiopsis sp. N85]MDE3723337.1 hypothetical protein [Nocardiopsis sp. N85]